MSVSAEQIAQWNAELKGKTPLEITRWAIAQGEGRIQLVLRGYGDPDSIKTEGAKSADVLAQLRSAPLYKIESQRPSSGGGSRKQTTAAPPVQVAPAPVLQAPAPPVQQATPKRPDSLTVQIFKGGKEEQRKFQKDSTKKPPL